MPQEVIFIRSDQYSFVKAGVPANMPTAGFKFRRSQSEPDAVVSDLGSKRCHHPRVDMQQPGLDFAAAAQYGRFLFLCGYFVTTDPQHPTSNKGDFFGDLYASK